MKLQMLGRLAGIAATCCLLGCGQITGPVAAEKSEYRVDRYNQAVDELQVEAPTMRSPMQVKTTFVPSSAAPGDTVRVVVKVRLMPGWHFYDYVPPGEPYKQTEWLMELGDGLQAVGNWNGPAATPYYTNPMMMVHEGQEEPLVFYRELVVGEGAAGELSIKAGMKYQICDMSMCLPPKKRVEELLLSVAK